MNKINYVYKRLPIIVYFERKLAKTEKQNMNCSLIFRI